MPPQTPDPDSHPLRQANGMCQTNSEDDCIGRMEPEVLLADGMDPAKLWKEYLVITSSRNAWARAASG